MKAIPYALIVGSLMYVMLCTRLNICFTIGMVSRYQSIGYLRRTMDYMLVYHYVRLLSLGYTNLDFQFDIDSWKSTFGFESTLNGGDFSWRSVKQVYIVDSIWKWSMSLLLKQQKKSFYFKSSQWDFIIMGGDTI